jgi:diadenosine tetraphosphate (Ap4A) HIT family hydrolase
MKSEDNGDRLVAALVENDRLRSENERLRKLPPKLARQADGSRQMLIRLRSWDGHPVSEGHTLVVPHRHVGSIFELGGEEQASIWNLVADTRNRIKYRPDAPPDIAAWAYEHAHR